MGCAASVPDEDKRNKKGKGKGKDAEPEAAPATAPAAEQPKTVEQQKPADTTPAVVDKPKEEPKPEPAPAEAKPVELKPEEPKPAEPKPEEPKVAEEHKPEEHKPEEHKPTEEPKPTEPKPEEHRPAEEHKPEEHKPAEPDVKPEEVKVETSSKEESAPKRQAKIAVVYYSMYGHILQLAELVAEGVRKAGAIADIYQVRETLPEEVLEKMHAPKKADYPFVEVNTLTEYDGFLFGIPTRYGIWPTQWKSFIDSTGQIWQSGGYYGKMGGVFTSTASQHGGIETTAFNAITFFVHHGICFVPLGYAKSFPELANMTEIVGGSPYGAGTMAGGDGSRQPTEIEKKVSLIQGETFAETVKRHFC